MKTPSGNKGLEFGNHAQIMGILNVTPDSFSDGGRFLAAEDIARQADRLIADGADLIDIGGESTRPFAAAVPADEELARVLPAIRMIRPRYQGLISIDTTKAEVASQALEAGADLINDISGLRFDPRMIRVACEKKAPVIIMHMQGTPRDMQVAPVYRDVVAEILDFFRERIAWAEENGLGREQIIIDPGIGFGKTVAHNLTILKHLREFTTLGCPLLVGHSRKSFIGKLLDLEMADRDDATAVLSAHCAASGAKIVRVHEVAKTRQAVRLIESVLGAA